MDSKYYTLQDVLKEMESQLKGIADNAPQETPDDYRAYGSLADLLEVLNDTRRKLEYLGTPAKVGRLKENPNGKFSIMYEDGTESYDLSCGSALEIEDTDPVEEDNLEWLHGRVEGRWTDNGNEYYFLGGRTPFPALYEGMKVRKRCL